MTFESVFEDFITWTKLTSYCR